MSLLKNIEEVAVEIQQQLVGGARCSCSCSCSCTCHGGSNFRNSSYTKSMNIRQNSRFQSLRG